MLVILVGWSGVGKSEFAKAMDCIDNMYISSKPMVEELQRRGVKVTHDSIHALAVALYKKDPYWQVPHILAELKKKKFLILDGPRQAREIKRLIELYPNTLVVRIEADTLSRWKRLKDRDDINFESFERIEKDETKETELEEVFKELVDITINNNGSLERLRKIAKMFGDLLKNLDSNSTFKEGKKIVSSLHPTKMKKKKLVVEAGHWDKTEWDVTPFKPGKVFWLPQKVKKIKISSKKRIVLRAPCRIDVGVLDYSALKTTGAPDYKAGEMSFAADKYTYVDVELLDRNKIVFEKEAKRHLLLTHVASLMKKATGYKGGFKIKARSHKYRHVGFGSSAILSEATAVAMNKLLGEPLSVKDLRKLIAYNFAEESDTLKSYLVPGASTGGSFNTMYYGGFVITSSETEMIFRMEIPIDTRFIVGVPQVKVAGPEASEVDINCLSWMRHNERFSAGKTSSWILMELLPACIQKNLKKMGNFFYNFTFFSKLIPMLLYRNDSPGIIFELKENSLEGAWMTSAGPGLVAFTQNKDKIKKAVEIFKRRGCNVVILKPDNVGIKEVGKF